MIYCVCLTVIQGMEVKLGVILPKEDIYPWALSKTIPAIEMAIETVSRNQLVENTQFLITQRDSQCSETMGPLAAIDMYIEQNVHVFIGPVCDYAVAPIARFSPHWHIPIITTGALVNAFGDKSRYTLLTRMQGSYGKAGEFISDMFHFFNWTTVELVHHDNIEITDGGRSDCFFIMEAIYYTMRDRFPSEPMYTRFDESSKHSNYEELLRSISQNSRSKLMFSSLQCPIKACSFVCLMSLPSLYRFGDRRHIFYVNYVPRNILMKLVSGAS